MAIQSVNYRPHKISPAYNPIVFGFTSDQIGQIDFSYVIDIYISYNGGDSDIIRIKQRQNPAGNCVVDIASIVQPYIQLALYSAEYGWNNTYRDSKEITAWVYLKVGEEYRSAIGQPLMVYDGIQNTTSAPPAFYIGSLEEATNPLKVIPAALPYYRHLENMQSTTNYVFWSDYFMDGDGKFLKRDDNSIDVTLNDRHTLTLLNWIEVTTNTYRNPIYRMSVKFYNSSNTLLSTANYNNTVSIGGGPQTTTNYGDSPPSATQSTTMLTFPCGPKDFNITDPNIAYYTVQADYMSNWTVPNNPTVSIASEIVRFNITDYCGNLYPRVRFSWLNDLGGRDYWNFTMFYEKTTTSTEENYSQTNLNWSQTLPLATSGNTTGNWLRGGDKAFNKTITTEFTAQSDWLLQSEVDLLAGLIESPSVWCYIGTDTYPYTVTITDTSYTYKNVKQTKLVQVTVKAKLTKIQIKQNL